VVLLPFGFVIFTILTLKRNIIIGAAIFGLLGVGFIFKSTGNAVLFRIQSAFLPDRSGDTMGVRFDNQQIIKPFIQSHPFGAGLGSVGEWGQRFSPHTFLASFPPDSGYVRVAVELGWVGYLLYCWMLYMIIRMSVGYYVRVRNEKIKVIYLSIICMMFMLLLASYVQEAIIQLPTSIQFYVCLAILTRLKDFDDELEGEEVSPSISYE
jgi:hypothetical protein